MLRLKKKERESPFIYKTPWHIGKREEEVKRTPLMPDVYTASWIGSLFKPAAEEGRNNRVPKPLSLKGYLK